MQDATELQIRQAQDGAAAIADEAASLDNRSIKPFAGYAELSPGPVLTEAQMLEKILALASAYRAAGDSEPERLEKILGLKLPPDVRNQRWGAAGRIGEGRYSWAAWKLDRQRPGLFIELTMSPQACLSYTPLSRQLGEDGFAAVVPTFGYDQRITFHRRVAPSVSLFVVVRPDRRDDPTCFTTVTFQLGRNDD